MQQMLLSLQPHPLGAATSNTLCASGTHGPPAAFAVALTPSMHGMQMSPSHLRSGPLNLPWFVNCWPFPAPCVCWCRRVWLHHQWGGANSSGSRAGPSSRSKGGSSHGCSIPGGGAGSQQQQGGGTRRTRRKVCVEGIGVVLRRAVLDLCAKLNWAAEGTETRDELWVRSQPLCTCRKSEMASADLR